MELSDGTRKSAKHILLAMGGRPVKPDMPGADLGITSNDIFHLDKLPKSILIIGGGYIACEFACILNGLGVKVTQYYRGAQVLRGFDDEARGLVAEEMQQNGIDLHLGTNILSLEREGDAIRTKATNGDEKLFDQVMFATGRAPNTEGMGLEALGVHLGRNGQVVVDQYSQSAIPSIYAVGDVTDRVNLTPVAIREGMAFVETVFGGNPTPVDHDLIPTAIFTQPEMGTVGLSEEAARDIEPVEIYCTSFQPMQSAFAGSPRPRADETGCQQGDAPGSGLSYRRARRGRDDPACGHRDQDGRDKRGFRPHRGGASDHVGRDRDNEIAGPDRLKFRAGLTG